MREKNPSFEEIKKIPQQDFDQKQVSACFSKHTLVHTIHGTREIQYLNVGDEVLARCEKTGRQEYRKVVKRFEHWEGTPTLGIAYHVAQHQEYGYDGIETTAEHPFWVNGLGWTKAEDLRPGHEFEICDPDGSDDVHRKMGTLQELALSGKRWQAKVVSVTQFDLPIPVFNLEVEEFHSYFVGVFGVWVHNKR